MSVVEGQGSRTPGSSPAGSVSVIKVRVTGPGLQDVRNLKLELSFPAALDSEHTLTKKGPVHVEIPFSTCI